MPRKKKVIYEAPTLLDITCQAAVRTMRSGAARAVKAWTAANYKGMTDTTRTLLNFWFKLITN